MNESRPAYRLPAEPPTPESFRDLAEFRELVQASLPNIRASAEKWRTGLAGFVTLVITGLFIKGPSSAAALDWPWRLSLTALIAGGLGIAIFGLWRALQAAAGEPILGRLNNIRADYGNLTGYQAALANTAANQLTHARRALMIALPLLAAAVLVWWWVPQQKPQPQIQVSIDGKTICGKLLSADKGTLRIKQSGESQERSVPFTAVINLRPVTTC
ncbi:hypothetical protein [Thermomonospora cellulosilytica]|uniref:Uncharacterized protein n=1 Tax=Thermomonospora cellulosilytica TaxID=1411118 RepID=A0A7W3R7N9_9ACTN|nr:hypothetical protein [Thermomonospora cellulosilytica]MBA9002836.1 hypothetical protein [Thermomonospora cellulosilytica]